MSNRTKGKQQDPNSMTYATKVLKEFLDSTQGDLEQVQKDYQAAKSGFEKAVEYFGENPKQTSPQSLFGIIARFSNTFKKAIEVGAKLKCSHRYGLSLNYTMLY